MLWYTFESTRIQRAVIYIVVTSKAIHYKNKDENEGKRKIKIENLRNDKIFVSRAQDRHVNNENVSNTETSWRKIKKNVKGATQPKHHGLH